MRHAEFIEAEPGKPVVRNPPRRRLRALPEQVGRGAPEHQDAPPDLGLVHEHAQGRKNLRTPLHVIEDDEPRERT